MAENELEDIKALLRRGGLRGAPEVVEIRPEIRSAGAWHLIDPDYEPDRPAQPSQPPTGTPQTPAPTTPGAEQPQEPAPQPGFAPGMMLRQVTYFVPTAEAARFQDWLFRNERYLHQLAPKGVTYLGTYGVFGKGGTYATFWRYDSFAAIQRMAQAVSDPLSDFGGFLRVLQQYPQIRVASDYAEQLYLPAQSSGLLTPGVTRDEQPGGARAPHG
ncbi:hypothetical protein JYK14_00535 [Siccirubricoccus sp. KC 17139]|uniref:NIPSNAP domain-containing protein n=1 Tax=Siccirubricoccus soli TaxID=2899147 RepID=A0ABT1CYF1_9PROT|nr:hypothetical protein [Siccirubricoccus soli]MCO6414667.1 hypothetical protein [Siccirubricoccus soli]MCP2680797.1 hypothetical protein [Siccirubricoccus soli]